MRRPVHDSPYRDAPAPAHEPSTPSPGRQRSAAAKSKRPRPPQSSPATQRTTARDQQSQADASAKPASRSRRGRSRRRGGSPYSAAPQLTSHPTGRAAYAETRQWLLANHGPFCAYCAQKFAPDTMTLDHVAPRRGRTAYDRRDNLVLACPACNAAKRDLAPMAFLLGNRARATNLARYGTHLSPLLIEMARSLAPDEPAPLPSPTPMFRWAEESGGESPYRD